MEFVYDIKVRRDGVLAHVKSGLVTAATKVDAARKARAKVETPHAIVSVYPTFYGTVHKQS